MRKIAMLCFVFGALTSAAARAEVSAAEWKKHPHFHKAYKDLEDAKKECGSADDGKEGEYAGHRAKALAHFDEAMKEIEQAVQAIDAPKDATKK
jgi:hypothetical protein